MFRLANVDGRAVLVDDTDWYDLARLTGDDLLADPMSAIARHAELHDVAAGLDERAPDGALDDTRLGVCVPRPSKVFAIGLNYRSHASESNLQLPPAPLAFTKFPNCLVGPTDDIVLPSDTVDWEVELVVVIGRGGRHIAAAEAWAHVAGLTLGQDVSDRTVQLLGSPPQFSLGKSYDTFGPIGPALVSVDSFPDPDDIGLWCDVAGERMQDARTNDLIFDVPTLVEYLSGICTLEPGDLIFTGTPPGVGMARKPPVWLKPGDVVEVEIDRLGTLRNPVEARP